MSHLILNTLVCTVLFFGGTYGVTKVLDYVLGE